MQTKKQSTTILLIVALTSPDGRFDSLFLSNYATINLLDELAASTASATSTSSAPASTRCASGSTRKRLQARGLVPADVIGAVNLQSRSTSAGQVGQPPVPQGQTFQYTITVLGGSSDVEEFENIIVKTDTGGQHHAPARTWRAVELGAQQYSQTFKLDGVPSAGLAVYQLPGANALEVAKRVEARMQSPGEGVPRGHGVDDPVRHDQVRRARPIHEVYKTLLEAGVLVLIVILVFLQDWRAMLVPATTVPVTIIGAFAAMAVLGFTVNMLDAVRPGPGHRHRRRRRDHRRGERGPPHRARAVPARADDQGDGRGARADHRHHAGADGGVPADGVPGRHHRADVPPVRPRHRRHGADQRHQRHDAQAGPVRAVAAPGDAARAAQLLLPLVQPRL